MLIEALVVSIIIGKLRKGRISNLGEIRLIRTVLLFMAIFIQVAINYFGRAALGSAGGVMHLSSYFFVFYFFWLNKQTFNIFLPLGTFLNFLVIALNKGSMPVDSRYMTDASIEKLAFSVTHTIMTETTIFPWLADIIYIKWPGQQLISIGDIFICAGIFIFIQRVMGQPRQGDRDLSGGRE
ncbi:MAG: DUF5317 domain-containing protein [Clostridia bacterium]|jgi:hypothetical protein|nr:DUF5317 domain-containing protein [Clostridia bacterium]